uniref:AmmeMemoRadiSam system radical SAM enzyme n=1 Tax=Staphylothermus marinus TaxID=2280 RepID=A0A7C4NNS7_STAMA
MVFTLDKPGVKEALFYEKLGGSRVKCNLCHKRCVIVDGAYGACGVRFNSGGKLYTLVYGLLTANNPDPIEKKPLMHFNPGSSVYSISTVGCNFYCRFCQNWVLSQSRRESLFGEPFEPLDVVEEAIKTGCQGISYTYNEPTVFYEFMLDTAKLAKSKGLFNTMVTNGYITPEAINALGSYMDAATVDFKASGNRDFYRNFMGVLDPEPTFQSILEMKKEGWWIEITNLIIPYYGDKVEDFVKLAKWIVENLGEETPVHLLRFHPHYMMENVPSTPIETLEKLAKIGFEIGLKHIYIGNVWGHELENTFCPDCGKLVVKRTGFYIIDWRLRDDFTCPYCGRKLNFRGKYWRSSRWLFYW